MNAGNKSRWKSAAAKFLVLCFGIVAALLLCEGILRLYNPFISSIHGNHIVLAVNRKIVFHNNSIAKLDPVITETRNSLGFRGPDPPADFEKYLTIITVGGSTTHCLYLSDDKTWPAALDRMLDQSFSKVWVNNAGLDGHSTVAHIALLEDHIVKLHPKVVTFLVGRNDMAHGEDDDWEAEGLKGPLSFSSPKLFMFSLSGHSEVAALMLNGYRSLTAYRLGLTHQDIDLTKFGTLVVPADEEARYLDHHRRFMPAYEERLRRLIEICRQAGIEPVLITQPMLAGPVVDDVTHVDLAKMKVIEKRSGDLLWRVLSLYNNATKEVGREHHVLVIDLGEQMPKSSRYFYDLIHFTDSGAEVAAGIINAGLCPMLAKEFASYNTASCGTPPKASNPTQLEYGRQ